MKNIVTYVDFDCGITFYPEAPTEVDRIIRSTENEKKTFPDLAKNPSAFQATTNVILFMSSIHLIYFWARTIYGTWMQQLFCCATRLMIGTLYAISTLKQQLTNLEQTYNRCSLRCERRTVRGRDCALHSDSFRKITYQTDDWRKQLLRLNSWVTFGSLEQWLEFQRLWWTVVVFKCTCLFQSLDFYCLLVHYLLFSGKKLFCCFFWWFLVRSKIYSTTTTYGNTPISSQSRSCPNNLQKFLLPCSISADSPQPSLYNLLQNLNRSAHCFIRRPYVIINESLKPHSISLYIASPMVSSGILWRTIPYLSRLIDTLGSDSLSYNVLLRWSKLGNTRPIVTEEFD